jgi:hypothetical protein
MKKAARILLNAVPILLMIGLIPLVRNDYALTAAYVAIIAVALAIRRYEKDILFLSFGFLVMIVSELFFIATGVETFERRSLFGIMPLWLPFLWAYCFVAMRRAIIILDK